MGSKSESDALCEDPQYVLVVYVDSSEGQRSSRVKCNILPLFLVYCNVSCKFKVLVT